MPTINGRRMKLALSNVEKHLQHEYAIGVFSSSSGSKFICFDVDDDNVDLVRGLQSGLIDAGFDKKGIHISMSGKKGYHVEVFFDSLLDHRRIQKLYQYILRHLSISGNTVECYPSATKSIKLPLSFHPDTHAICWYLDDDTLECIEHKEHILTIQPMQTSMAKSLIDAIDSGHANDSIDRPLLIAEKEETPDVRYPFAPITQKGTRHRRMVEIAVYLRSRGLSQPEISSILFDWISEQDRSLYKSSDAEVARDIREICVWVFSKKYEVAYCSPDSVQISSSSIEKILSFRVKSLRKLLFLLIVCERSGQVLTQAQIAAILDISERSVRRLLRSLTEKQILLQTYGTIKKTRKGFLCKKPSQYRVSLTMALPAKIKRIDEAHRFVQVYPRLLFTNFCKTYYGALLSQYEHSELCRVLTDQEQETITSIHEEEEDGICCNGNQK